MNLKNYKLNDPICMTFQKRKKQGRSVVAWDQELGKYNDCTVEQGKLLVYSSVLYLLCRCGYMTSYILQNSLNCSIFWSCRVKPPHSELCVLHSMVGKNSFFLIVLNLLKSSQCLIKHMALCRKCSKRNQKDHKYGSL